MKSRLKLRLSGTTRGKWKILDGKDKGWCVFIFGAQKVVAPPSKLIMDLIVWALMSKN
jgi:hypothetical protein